MNFTEYRSKSLNVLWQRLRKDGIEQRHVCNDKDFSTWAIDDVCAVNWKHENPIDVCVFVLYSYVVDDVLGAAAWPGPKTVESTKLSLLSQVYQTRRKM